MVHGAIVRGMGPYWRAECIKPLFAVRGKIIWQGAWSHVIAWKAEKVYFV